MAAGYRGSETSERWISLHQRRSDKDRKPPYILTLSLGRLVILTFSQIYPATGTSPMRWYCMFLSPTFSKSLPTHGYLHTSLSLFPGFCRHIQRTSLTLTTISSLDSGGASQVKIEVVGSQIQALSSRTSWAPNDMFYTLETPEGMGTKKEMLVIPETS